MAASLCNLVYTVQVHFYRDRDNSLDDTRAYTYLCPIDIVLEKGDTVIVPISMNGQTLFKTAIVATVDDKVDVRKLEVFDSKAKRLKFVVQKVYTDLYEDLTEQFAELKAAIDDAYAEKRRKAIAKQVKKSSGVKLSQFNGLID